jgi:hypothetical protein
MTALGFSPKRCNAPASALDFAVVSRGAANPIAPIVAINGVAWAESVKIKQSISQS